MATVEEERLVQASEGEVDADSSSAARTVYRSFIIFAFCFSLTLGTATASIPLATSQFGDTLGSYSLGTLYSLYTVMAMFGSVPILSALGTKPTLILGQALYALYVGSYLLGREIEVSAENVTGTGAPVAFSSPTSAPTTPPMPSNYGRWVVVIIGAAIGGCASGLIWPAQQGYMVKCSTAYAKFMTPAGADQEEIAQVKGAATARFSSIFATVYLGIEVLMKVLSSLIQLWTCQKHWHGDFLTGRCGIKDQKPEPSEKNEGQIIVFVLYLTLAVIACFLMIIVPIAETDEEKAAKQAEGEKKKIDWLAKSKGAVLLMYENPKILLMSGVNMAFGGTSAYLNSYVTGTVIKQGLGDDKVGYFVSIIPLVAFAMSTPVGKLMQALGTKVPFIILGMCCFGGFALAFAVVSDPVEDLGKWAVLPVLFVLYGAARAVWEGPNKAVTGDFFPGDEAVKAGANAVFQNGLTSAVAFYVYPSLSSRVKSIVCVCFAAWGIIGFLIAHVMFARERAAKAAAAKEVDGA